MSAKPCTPRLCVCGGGGGANDGGSVFPLLSLAGRLDTTTLLTPSSREDLFFILKRGRPHYGAAGADATRVVARFFRRRKTTAVQRVWCAPLAPRQQRWVGQKSHTRRVTPSRWLDAIGVFVEGRVGWRRVTQTAAAARPGDARRGAARPRCVRCKHDSTRQAWTKREQGAESSLAVFRRARRVSPQHSLGALISATSDTLRFRRAAR